MPHVIASSAAVSRYRSKLSFRPVRTMLKCGLVRLAAKRGGFALVPAVDSNA
jgi:hypothetical protein